MKLSILNVLPFSFSSKLFSFPPSISSVPFRSVATSNRASVGVFELQRDSVDFKRLQYGSSTLYDPSNQRLKISLHDVREDSLNLLVDASPEVPSELFSLGGEDFTQAANLYRIKVLCHHLGYLEAYIPRLRDLISKYGTNKGIKEALQDLSGLGFEVQIVFSACSVLLTKYQSKVQAFAGLDLSLPEISELEKVREGRRVINTRYTNIVASESYAKMTIRDQDEVMKSRDKELASVTTVLYQIVTMGTSYLTSSSRLALKLDPKLSLEELLTSFRRAEIAKYRADKAVYSLPKSVS